MHARVGSFKTAQFCEACDEGYQRLFFKDEDDMLGQEWDRDFIWESEIRVIRVAQNRTRLAVGDKREEGETVNEVFNEIDEETTSAEKKNTAPNVNDEENIPSLFAEDADDRLGNKQEKDHHTNRRNNIPNTSAEGTHRNGGREHMMLQDS